MKKLLTVLFCAVTLIAGTQEIVIKPSAGSSTAWLTCEYPHKVGTNLFLPLQPGTLTRIRKSTLKKDLRPAPQFGTNAFMISGITCVRLKEWREYTNTHPASLVKRTVEFWK